VSRGQRDGKRIERYPNTNTYNQKYKGLIPLSAWAAKKVCFFTRREGGSWNGW